MSSHAEGEVWEGGGKRYRMEKVVGNGAFGIVWRAKDLESGMQVAIKKVILDRRYHNRELEMMRQLDHDCVIKLLNHFEKTGRKPDETCLHLVMDYVRSSSPPGPASARPRPRAAAGPSPAATSRSRSRRLRCSPVMLRTDARHDPVGRDELPEAARPLPGGRRERLPVPGPPGARVRPWPADLDAPSVRAVVSSTARLPISAAPRSHALHP